jgi:hypothetical protein
MHRVLLTTAVAATLIAACGAPPRFQDMRTPSGEFCSDMPVFPAGQMPDHEHHRLQPIQSEPKARTEAERLESLRKAACFAGGDAVIEATQEEIRLPDATYGMVASGTAIIWTRRPGVEFKPIKGPTMKEEAKQEAPPAEPKAPPPEEAPPTTATPAPTTSASAGPATAPTSPTKTKTTTKTKTK